MTASLASLSILSPAIFGLSGLTLNADERAFFREADPAGYILFGRNIESREQVRARPNRRARSTGANAC